MVKAKKERKFRRNGEYLIVRATGFGIELTTGDSKRPVTRKYYGWRWKELVVIGKAIVAGDMPLYAAADWFEENAGFWSNHGNKQVPRDWLYCIRLLQQFA